MARQRLSREDLVGKTIDAHAHLGVSLKAYGACEYPYAQSAEGLYYKQRSGGVDVNVVFPFTADLHFDPKRLIAGEMRPAARPISPVPYAGENRLLLREIYDYCPEIDDHFLPFVCIDPARKIGEQIEELVALERDYPIYGIKVNPVGCQSRAIELFDAGAPLLDFAEERDLPLLFHTTFLPGEEYSQASDIFRIIDARPGLRFCLAHCIFFHREFLQRADSAANVWVDTSALKIQVELLLLELGKTVQREQIIDADFDDHTSVMRTLCELFPNTIIWGTDAPAYAYICRRKQGEGQWIDFRLKGVYEDEIAALDALSPEARTRASNINTLHFLFGA